MCVLEHSQSLLWLVGYGWNSKMRNYCVVCEWSANPQNRATQQGHPAIEHFLATGHSIASDRQSSDSCDSNYQIQHVLK
ncbi:hypothetical protein HAPAU_40660 [Halalkalicoccus paucihalophilus]|uniref:Uncharacterized protein n=1 Tax=Halalkalicoccus paucihalophilus TaxID=1008153 RepID=A0A151A9C9_9EURY|nr:hypothetical protein HAPAU_40660 [Halalkalicoccus paucihalophilus]